MASEFTPHLAIADYNRAIDAVVRPDVESHIAKDGAYVDWAQRNIFFCTNNK
jgi:hypothetical protein